MRKSLLLLLGVLFAFPAFASDFTYTYQGQTLTYTVIDEAAKTCMPKEGYSSKPGNNVSGTLVIPEMANGYKVTSIGEYAFYGCSGLTSVTIPNSVTSIGGVAFYGCRGLTSVTIPNSVTSIGKGTFDGCSGLTSVTIPNSVTYIGNYAFDGCSGLTSVTIPNSVTYIGNYAFGYCSGLTSVTIPNSVTEIGEGTFYGCRGLTSVTIPNSVTSIGEEAFYGCSGLTSVTIPNSVTYIGGNAFEGCSGLKKSAYPNSILNPFPAGTTFAYNPEGAIIEDNWVYGSNKSDILFAPCSLEGEYTIPNSVTSIGNYAFYSCSGMADVIIGNSVTEISEKAFYGCSKLMSVKLSESLTSLGSDVFKGCTSIREVEYPATAPVEAQSSVFEMTVYDNATLYLPVGAMKKYEEIKPWRYFSKIKEKDFPASIHTIAADTTGADREEVYNLNGVKVGDSTENLTPGIYIVRLGSTTKKIALQ